MKPIIIAVLPLMSVGCDRIRSYGGYLVVKQEFKTVSWQQELSCTPYQDLHGNCVLMMFTLTHKGNIIKAHCQTWAGDNHCRALSVGEVYDLSRDASLGFLSLKEPNVVLAVEEERRDY